MEETTNDGHLCRRLLVHRQRLGRAVLATAHGYTERAIVSFPGAWILVGLPLTLSFGTSSMFFVRALFYS